MNKKLRPVARQSNCACGGGCPACQEKSDGITISQPTDTAEVEADKIADDVMRKPSDDSPSKKNKYNSAKSVREVNNLGKNEHQTINRKSSTASRPTISQSPAHVDKALNSGGRPLDNKTREFYESRINHDFGNVRVHTGALAHYSATALDADAYTVGSHIVFSGDRYAPGSAQGKHLLGHELAHVAQQSSATPRIQRRPRRKRKDESAPLNIIKNAITYVGDALDEAKQDDYARSIVGDFVSSKNLLDFSHERKQKQETYKKSKLSTETYFIAVKQKPDGKDAKKPWSIIVDQHVTFSLNGQFKGQYHIRDFARLNANYEKMPSPSTLINVSAYDTSQPKTNVTFETPNFFSTSVVGNEKPASTFAKRAKGSALFDLAASAKARVQALEKLIPGFQPVSAPNPQDDLPGKKQADKKPDPRPHRDQVTEEDDEQTVRTPDRQPSRVQEYKKTRGDDKTIEVETEVAAEKDEGGWLSGLFKALKSIALGLGIFAAAVLAVVVIAFVITGSVIALPVAAAIAGAFLLGYGLGTALRQRFGQDAYKGRPFAAIGRSLLDTVGITGIQEAYTGKDAATGRKLTEEERTERGTLGTVSLLTLLWGGLKGRGGKTSTPRTTAPTTPAPVPAPIKPTPVPIEPPSATVKPTPTPLEPVPVEPAPAPAPVEPLPAPIKPVPAPVEPVPAEPAPAPSPAPAEPLPAPVEPVPAEPVPAPKPTPAPLPNEPVPAPTKPSPVPAEPPADTRPSPKDSTQGTPATKTKSSGAGARTRMADVQQGLRDAITRLKDAITESRKDGVGINKERIAAQTDMLQKQQRVQKMDRSDPARTQALKEFQEAKAKFEELQQQYDFRKNKTDELVEKEAQYTKALNNKTYERPTSYNAGVENAVWESAVKQGNGSVKSPSGVEIRPGDNWVMGHKPGWEFWKHQVSAARRGITREQFLKEFNESKNYRPETAADNGSHRFEAPDNISYWP